MLIREIAEFLNDNGQGVFDINGTGGNIFLGALPTNPKDLLAVYLRSGGPTDPRNEYINASVQIIIRDESKLQGMTRGQALIPLLNGKDDAFTTGGATVIDCLVQQAEPVELGTDANGLYEWGINLSIDYRR